MKCIMPELLNSLVELKEFIDENDINKLLKTLKNIKKEKLYVSLIHGLYHSEKVFLFSYIIAKNQNLNPIDFQIIIDAALYHDNRRENDFEDEFHGYVSACSISSIVADPIYEDKTNLEMLKAIVDVHSQKDRNIERNFFNYELENSEYNRYKLLASILKDADALDRTRFSEKSLATLNPKFLRLDISKKLIPLAYRINQEYYKIMEENQIEHKIDTSKKGICFHSISFDFFKLDSILKYGILSSNEVKNKNLDIPKNFNGGNSNNWISVVDASLIKYNYTGFQNFTKHGISFFCNVPEMINSVENCYKSQAICNGLPYNKSNHLDEKYVYKNIPVQNIIAIIIPNNYINIDIKTLTYLYNSLDFDLFIKRIKYYIQKFKEEDISIFDTNYYTKDKFENTLTCYEIEIKKFIFSEKTKDSELILKTKLDVLLKQLNSYIQNAMNRYYQKVLDRDLVTVLDVTQYEILKTNIQTDTVFSDTEVFFLINHVNELEKSVETDGEKKKLK